MWALSNRSPPIAKMFDAFYAKTRAWIETMIRTAAPDLDMDGIAIRAALITAQIEGLIIPIGPNRAPDAAPDGIETVAMEQIERLAFLEIAAARRPACAPLDAGGRCLNDD